MKIQKLSPDLINKIAAGEVVERPASVIKELIENSIDANASIIEVHIQNAGKDYMCVQDNGDGMNEEDAKLSIAQHATSKIFSLEDLTAIQTFGFRGEALASISSVSDFVLQTKDSGSTEGVRLTVIDNKEQIEVAPCNQGTKIVIKNLFKHIPARRSFLKSNQTEYSHILDCITQFALAYLHIQFKFLHNGKQIFNLPACSELSMRVEQLLGKELSAHMMTCNYKDENYSLSGLVGKPHIAHPSRSHQYLFINKRPVYNALINKAIQESFASLIPAGRFPVFVLFLTIDPQKVDVNVHPRKLEVRFLDSQSIFRFVLQAIRVCIKENNIFKKIQIDSNTHAAPQTDFRPRQRPSLQPQLQMQKNHQFIKSEISIRPPRAVRSLELNTLLLSNEQTSADDVSGWRLLGQVKNSYLLVEDEQKGLLLVDQHAASERINYEKISRDYYNGTKKSAQKLLMPIHIDLAPKDFNRIISYTAELAKMGFDIEPFGEQTVIINSVPSLIKNKDIKKIIAEIVSGDQERLEKSDTLDYLLKTISCKAAVKFGDTLSREAQVAMLQDLQKINNRMACAHGRPIILELSWDEIHSKFERT